MGALKDFRFYEVGNYFTNFQLGSRVYPGVISESVWNKLPADIQKVILDSASVLIRIAYDEYVKADHLAIETMKEKKIEFFQPTAADDAVIKKVESGQSDKWAEKYGEPGKKILADYRNLVEKYEKINPYKK